MYHKKQCYALCGLLLITSAITMPYSLALTQPERTPTLHDLETSQMDPIELAPPKDNSTISYNRLINFTVPKTGMVINNAHSQGSTIGVKTIILEVGEGISELRGKIQVLGGPAKLIIINPHGIHVDGCKFINVSAVELKTATITQDQHGSGTLGIGPLGIEVPESSLKLTANKIEVLGTIAVADNLNLEVPDTHSMTCHQANCIQTGKPISFAPTANLFASSVEIVVHGQDTQLDLALPTPNTSANFKPEDYHAPVSLYVQVPDGEILVSNFPTQIQSARFLSRSFRNLGIISANNLEFQVTNAWVNEGTIEANDYIYATAQSFYNYKDIFAGGAFLLKGAVFTNDVKIIGNSLAASRGARLKAGSVAIQMNGAIDQTFYKQVIPAVGIYQGFDSSIEAQGDLLLVSKAGKIYLGHKKVGSSSHTKPTSLMIDTAQSRITSKTGQIYIQARGDVTLLGTRVEGNLIVETGGIYQANDAVIVTTKNVFSHTESWCKGATVFGSCVGGGYGYKDKYKDVSYLEEIFLNGKLASQIQSDTLIPELTIKTDLVGDLQKISESLTEIKYAEFEIEFENRIDQHTATKNKLIQDEYTYFMD